MLEVLVLVLVVLGMAWKAFLHFAVQRDGSTRGEMVFFFLPLLFFVLFLLSILVAGFVLLKRDV